MFDERYRKQLNQQQNAGLYRTPPLIAGKKGTILTINGKNLLNFASNDYLGLASDPRVMASLSKHFGRMGCSSSSSRLVTGNHSAIRETELKFAEYFGYEDALFFPSGFQANLAILSTLFGKGDALFFDKRIHASSVKGIMLSSADFYGYRHNAADHLEKRLQNSGKKPSGLVTESLFSMDGDRPDFNTLLQLKNRHGFMAVVDEAHAFGVLGKGGRGIGRDVADVALGTMGKAFGLFGAFVLLPRLYREYLLNFAAPLIYTTSLPEAHAAGASDILDIVEKSEDRRQHLVDLNILLTGELRKHGMDVKGNDHIVSITIGDEQKSLTLSRRLYERNLFVFPARYPTVPLGRAILRISLTALHTERDIRRLIDELVFCSKS